MDVDNDDNKWGPPHPETVCSDWHRTPHLTTLDFILYIIVESGRECLLHTPTAYSMGGPGLIIT